MLLRNPANGNAVQLDLVDTSSESRFEGWGPTISFELMQPVGCDFSIYANVRGSFLWGIETLTQSSQTQNRFTTAGVSTFTNTSIANAATDRRVASIGEGELGVQYGRRVGTCYMFTRVGLVVQRWWQVGNPVGINGNVEFVGGTVTFGVTY